MKIYIATPMYGGMCTTAYTSGALDLQIELFKLGHQVEFAFIYNESLITRARNSLVHNFLKTDFDVFLFIDADQGFDVSTVIRLLESPEDIIGGIYPLKGIQWDTVMLAHAKGLKNYELYTGIYVMDTAEPVDVLTFDENVPLEVAQIGTGMMKINRKVFEELAPLCDTYINAEALTPLDMDDRVVEFFKTEIDEQGVLLSEDYYFCHLWRKQGNKVYGAPWVYVTHSGHYNFAGSYANTIKLLASQYDED